MNKAGVNRSFSSLCTRVPHWAKYVSLKLATPRQSLYQERHFAQVLTWLKIPEFSIFIL